MSTGTPQDVTNQATWQSADSAIAAVSSGGLVTGVATGFVEIRATYQGFIGTAPVAVATNVDVTGRWVGTASPPTFSVDMTLTQMGTAVSGTLTFTGAAGQMTGPLTGTLNGAQFIFSGWASTGACTASYTSSAGLTSTVSIKGHFVITKGCTSEDVQPDFSVTRQ
jgi:hypothetical protein